MSFLLRYWAESPISLWLSCIAIGTVLEMFGRVERDQPWQARTLNVVHALLYSVVIFVTAPIVFGTTSAVARSIGLGLIDLRWIGGAGFLSQVLIAALTLFATDFFYYWLHRAQHTFPILWDQHTVHHSDESVNVSTATRHHWTEFIFQAFTVSLPLAILFQLPPVTIWSISIAMGAWQFFNHANFRMTFGRFAWLVSGPQLHRIHHSRLPEHADKNFAAYFPIWDVLFRTYWAPQPCEYPPTGLASGERIRTLTALTLSPFVAWWQRIAGK